MSDSSRNRMTKSALNDATRFLCTAIEKTMQGAGLYDRRALSSSGGHVRNGRRRVQAEVCSLPAELKRMIDGRWHQMANMADELVEAIKL